MGIGQSAPCAARRSSGRACGIHRALKPGGLHFASYKGGGCEGRDRFGRYFNYFAREELETVYREAAPWDWLELAEGLGGRSEEHTSELQSLMRISYAVFCLKKKTKKK